MTLIVDGVTMTAQSHGLTVELAHGPSGARLDTVPPKDNGGDGSSFSPTDLLGASLAACALATMALTAGREGLHWGDARAEVVKLMVGPPRRVGALPLRITMPKGTPAEQRSRLEEAARGCPVARSLHPDLRVTMEFSYPS